MCSILLVYNSCLSQWKACKNLSKIAQFVIFYRTTYERLKPNKEFNFTRSNALNLETYSIFNYSSFGFIKYVCILYRFSSAIAIVVIISDISVAAKILAPTTTHWNATRWRIADIQMYLYLYYTATVYRPLYKYNLRFR